MQSPLERCYGKCIRTSENRHARPVYTNLAGSLAGNTLFRLFQIVAIHAEAAHSHFMLLSSAADDEKKSATCCQSGGLAPYLQRVV